MGPIKRHALLRWVAAVMQVALWRSGGWVLALVLPCCAMAVQPTRGQLTIAFFADLHGQITTHAELFWDHDRQWIAQAGGVDRMATIIKGLRDAQPGRVLVVDGGDTIQGSALASWTQGAAVARAMNILDVDIGVPGNWEVIYGLPVLLQRASELSYPLVAANMVRQDDGRRLFAPYRLFHRGGMKLAIIGYTDPDVPWRQPPSYSAGIRYRGREVLQELVDEVRSKGAQVVVVLSHVGLIKAVSLAEELKGVDVVLSADSHERTTTPIVRGDTWVVEPGAFGSFIGVLELHTMDGRLARRHWRLQPVLAEDTPPDPSAAAQVSSIVEPYRGRLERVIGHTKTPLMRHDVIESTMDAVMADAVMEATGAEMALTNGFRFAAVIEPGPIVEADLWNAFPFTEPLRVGRITGAQFRAFWEQELDYVLSRDPDVQFGGWLPRVAGVTLRFSPTAAAGRRIVALAVQDKPIEAQRFYTLASCRREGDPPDTLCRIPDAQEAHDLSIDVHQAIRRYLAAHDPLPAPKMDRVVGIGLPQAVHSQYFDLHP